MTAGIDRESPGRVPWRALALVALVGSLVTAPGQGQAEDPPPPVEGVVVQISQIDQDFFVQLDLDADEKGDQWAKIVGTIQTPAGKKLTLADIKVGTRLRITQYEQNAAGFLEALKVIVLPDANNSGNGEGAGPGKVED